MYLSTTLSKPLPIVTTEGVTYTDNVAHEQLNLHYFSISTVIFFLEPI